MLAAAACSSVMNGLIREVSGEIHPFEIAFFRNLFGFVVLLPLIIRAGPGMLRTEKLGLHALRGGLNVVAMLSFFMAVTLAPLAEVAALSFSAPLFATLLAILVLGEKVGIRRWSGLALGFLGALVILRPGVEAIGTGAALALFSSMMWAGALIVIKVLARTDSSLAMTIWAALFLTPVSLLAALPFWQWPGWQEIFLLMLVGALGSATQMSVAQAFHEADATLVLPFDFTKLIWASLIGIAFFAEVPDAWTWIGGSVIFASATYIAYRERKVGPRRTS